MVALASKVYSEAVAIPVMARFVIFTRSHHETEAQLRVLCITEDFDVASTLECQEKFHEIARSDPVEVCVLDFYSGTSLVNNSLPSILWIDCRLLCCCYLWTNVDCKFDLHYRQHSLISCYRFEITFCSSLSKPSCRI